MKIYSLKILNIKKETGDTISIHFKQPGLKKIKYLAGQYISLILNVNGRKYIRPYSFSSSPLKDENLIITIKKIKNGIVSSFIHDNIKVGDIIEVIEPQGEYIYIKKDEIEELYFWCVGTGITPMIQKVLKLSGVSVG